jgi:ATP-dependent Clp protease ATP-binding subunit ClpA
MFERFTERARKVIILAREEAIRLRHSSVGTEHLLLGLIREGDGLAISVLKKLNVDVAAVKAEIEKKVPVGNEITPGSEMPFTSQAKKVLEHAIPEARSLNHNYIGTEHLLLGLVREGEGIASLVLRDFGVSAAAAKAQVQELSAGQPSRATDPAPSVGFERFSERARTVILLARDEAIRLGHTGVDTEHLLLGLIREGDGWAVALLSKLNVNIAAVKSEVEKNVAAGSGSSTGGDIPFTPQAKKVLECAIAEARSLRHNYLGTEHLLLGLTREGEGTASRVLRDFGVDVASVRGLAAAGP